MEKSSKRGKIPQSDWPLIMARYDSGETLASIARTYDCSPPAISYVVSRSRVRQTGAETPPPAPSTTAPQLIKAAASEPAVSSNAQAPAASTSPANGQASDRPETIWPREANGFARDGAGEHDSGPPGMAPRAALPVPRPPASHAAPGPANGDHRRTLHLSLGNAPQGNGGTAPAEHHPAERHNFASEGQHAQQQQPQHQTAGERFAPAAKPDFPDHPSAPDRGRDGAAGAGFSEARSTAYAGPVQRTDSDVAGRKDGAGSYIGHDLRTRVDGDIVAFLAAFDAALVEDTQESRSALREATDRLLRAGARTRIELERLEARMPLPPRDNIGRSEPAWRQR
jgi:transposase-like protein